MIGLFSHEKPTYYKLRQRNKDGTKKEEEESIYTSTNNFTNVKYDMFCGLKPSLPHHLLFATVIFSREYIRSGVTYLFTITLFRTINCGQFLFITNKSLYTAPNKRILFIASPHRAMCWTCVLHNLDKRKLNDLLICLNTLCCR
jgi:hypothetical protein